jgi:hypothetical protein
MQARWKKHGTTFNFDEYLALTFASNQLVDELASMLQRGEHGAVAKKMVMFQDRYRNAPTEIRKSLTHYLGKRDAKLESFNDLPELLKQLKK